MADLAVEVLRGALAVVGAGGLLVAGEVAISKRRPCGERGDHRCPHRKERR